MSNVADYAEARAMRDDGLPTLDMELALEVGDEMAAALRAAPEFVTPMEEAPDPTSPLEAQWLRFRDAFTEAMAGGLETIDDLERMVLTGEAYLFPGSDAAVVAKRVTYSSGEAVLQTLWAVGDLNEVLTLEPALCATARLVGCSRVLVEGRKGWEKLLKPAGYDPWSVTLCKVL